MVKITIEEDGKVIRKETGDIAIGFLSKEDVQNKEEVHADIFIAGMSRKRSIITCLSFLCIEVMNALTDGSKMLRDMYMQMFKKVLDEVESDIGFHTQRDEIIKEGEIVHKERR